MDVLSDSKEMRSVLRFHRLYLSRGFCSPRVAALGDTVEISMKISITKEDKEFVVQDTGRIRPERLLIGDDDVFPLFTKKVLGMREGEKRRFVIPKQDAYGEHDPEQVFSITPDPGMKDIKEGSYVELTDGTNAHVVSVSEDKIVLDSNNLYAGEDLHFFVSLEKFLDPEDIKAEEN